MEIYYTPSLEEFYVGFEYEMWETHSKLYDKNIDDSKWVKKKHKLTSISFNKLHDRLSDCRVKYLDEEDIESLGWFYKDEGFYEIDKTYFSEEEGYSGHVYRLFYNKRKLTIEKLNVKESNGEPYYDLYEGNQNHIVKGMYIKNKSELKKLMGQLNIK